MALYTLQSRDGVAFSITKKMADSANVVKEMIEDEAEDDDDDSILFLPLQSRELKRVVAFMEYHENDPMGKITRPVSREMTANGVSAWDVDFIHLPIPELIALWQAANYVDMADLLLLVEAKVASMLIQGGDELEQIAKQFRVSTTIELSDGEVLTRFRDDKARWKQVMAMIKQDHQIL